MSYQIPEQTGYGYNAGYNHNPAPQKEIVLAYILWWFLGTLGIHMFYLGETRRGLMYLKLLAGTVGFFILTMVVIAVGASSQSGIAVAAGFGFLLGTIIFSVMTFVRWIIDAFKMPEINNGTFTFQK